MEQHEEQEHEVYGGEIPDEEGEVDADMSGGAEDYEGNEHDLEHDPNSNSKDLEDMKKRLKEIEDEAGALREMQAKVEKEMGAVQDSSELHGRQLKVSAKRTNVPGMKQYRGRRPNPYFRSRRPFMPGPVFYPPYSYGRVPRFRRPTRYRPY
uniref:Uncharacterized protein n=1 Tax=Gossypium raimondii TaxID=29730 RepID=A0A0D2PUR6_GOSRA|nr:hypothetical protein B456_001G052500 [Gossypium raimondii]